MIMVCVCVLIERDMGGQIGDAEQAMCSVCIGGSCAAAFPGMVFCCVSSERAILLHSIVDQCGVLVWRREAGETVCLFRGVLRRAVMCGRHERWARSGLAGVSVCR